MESDEAIQSQNYYRAINVFIERDWIEIYDGSDENAEKLGRLCGQNPGQISSSGSSLLLWFHSAVSTRPHNKKDIQGYRVIADVGERTILQ